MTSAVVFAYHNVGVRCLEVLLAHGIEVPDASNYTGSQRSRISGEERDPEWLFEAGESDVVRDGFPRAWRSTISTRSTPVP